MYNVKFNASDTFYDVNFVFVPAHKLMTLNGELPQDDAILTSGFKFYDPRNNNAFLGDYSDYKLIWDGKTANSVTLSSDMTVYKTYLVANEYGYVVGQKVTDEDLTQPYVALYRSGRGKIYRDEQPMVFNDEDGCPLFIVENGQWHQTTAAEKEEWLKGYTFNIIFVADDEGFIRSFRLRKVSDAENDPIQENEIIYDTQVSLDGQPDTYNIKLIDDEGYPTSKLVNGQIIDVTAEDIAMLKERDREAQAENERRRIQESKNNKINELREECGRMITRGIDMDGSHYSYDTSDQANMSNLISLAKSTGLSLPYHADGESCRLFTTQELTQLYVLQETNVTHHTTYYNQVKRMIENMENEDDWNNFKYGDELTGEYLETYTAMMTAAQEVINAFLSPAE